MLFVPANHEPLREERWDEARAREAIARIVADTDAGIDPDGLWPAHPRDEWEEEKPSATVYLGAAGVVWALDALRRHDAAEVGLDLPGVIERAAAQYREQPDVEGDPPGLWLGESGLLLVAERVGSAAADADRLLARVRENIANETWELMWGSPGTMLAARAMLGWTGEEQWAQAWRESAERLWAEWGDDGLWTQHLYGHVGQIFGPAHGFAGNVLALAQGGERLDELRARVAATLEKIALREDGLANWPPAMLSRTDELRVQWCHGAPGIVASLAALMPEELALAGAELTWSAGPLVKGGGLCHGTGGNGYAFLKMFELTGDELWLERARAFAMHAIGQVEGSRYSLWTGDIGIALYLWSCATATADVPTIDYW